MVELRMTGLKDGVIRCKIAKAFDSLEEATAYLVANFGNETSLPQSPTSGKTAHHLRFANDDLSYLATIKF